MPEGLSPVHRRTVDADDTQVFARALAGLLQPGDVLILVGGLGAGKTTFTQGLGEGLGVRGPITSPTFVVSREHPSLVGGPALVHVDAYRLGDAAELDDVDLDAELDRSVTVVEWGAGLAEELAPDRLEIELSVQIAPDGGESRDVTVRGHGDRWAAAWPQVQALA